MEVKTFSLNMCERSTSDKSILKLRKTMELKKIHELFTFNITSVSVYLVSNASAIFKYLFSCERIGW